jgi:hypothetical protein
MDLFAKVTVAIVVIILIGALLFVLLQHFSSSAVTEKQAESYVISDLKQQNPNVSISIINVSPSTLAKGSWNVIVGLVYNGTRACPTVLIEGYDYPAMTLLSNIYDLYTTGCRIYGISSAPSYVISLPQIAVARATNVSSYASSYVYFFGYDNTIAKAHYFSALNSSSTPLSENFTDVWLVNYTATNAHYSEYIVLSESGSVLGNYSASK